MACRKAHLILVFSGDVAIGDGVARHFLSLVIHKLKHGFAIDVGKF